MLDAVVLRSLCDPNRSLPAFACLPLVRSVHLNWKQISNWHPANQTLAICDGKRQQHRRRLSTPTEILDLI